MDLRSRTELFGNMVRCCHNLYMWEYDEELKLLYTNCDSALEYNGSIPMNIPLETIRKNITGSIYPVIISNEIGMTWVIIPVEKVGFGNVLYVLGPLFIDAVSVQSIEASLLIRSLSAELRRGIVQFIRGLPVISVNRMMEYTIMFYYCLTGEKIAISDLRHMEGPDLAAVSIDPDKLVDRHGTYEAEQEMLQMVREGNLNYRSHIDKLAMTGTVGTMSVGDPMRQIKNAVNTQNVLFSRAAIEGGLSPEVSLTLSDYYFQRVEAAVNPSELGSISSAMQEDYIRRVHQRRNTTASKPVQNCCDYISLHIEEDINIETLALREGYTAAYLRRKFIQEKGIAIKEYIQNLKLERAKQLLQTTKLSVQDISDRLNFCSHSYFTKAFRQAYGVAPTIYRKAPPNVTDKEI